MASSAHVALLLLSPTGAGKHTVINRISELGLAPVELCCRDSTRPKQPWDNGTLRSFPRGTTDEHAFHDLRNSSGYLAVMSDASGYLYGIRKNDVEEMLRRGSVPVLRGIPGNTAGLKKWLAGLEFPVDLVTVFMITNPPDAWEEVVRKRSFDVDERISAARNMLRDLGMSSETPSIANALKRFGIDHFVINRWSDLDATARMIASLLR